MGYICHNVIVVSSWNRARIEAAREKAVEVFSGVASVTEVAPHRINCGGSFMVAPDGSKEGWEESDKGDARRAAFCDWLNDQRYCDGSSHYSWADIAIGEDSDSDTKVVRHRGSRSNPKSAKVLQ